MFRKIFLDYLCNRIGELHRYLKVMPTGKCVYTYSPDRCIEYKGELEFRYNLLKQSTIYKLGKIDANAPIFKLITDGAYRSDTENEKSLEKILGSLIQYIKEDNVFIESYVHTEKEEIGGKVYYNSYTYRCLHVLKTDNYITIIPYMCTVMDGKIDVIDLHDFRIIFTISNSLREVEYIGLNDFGTVWTIFQHQLHTFFMFYVGFLKLISCKNVIARATEIRVSKKKKRKGYVPEYFYTLGFVFNRSEVEKCSLRINRSTAMVTFSDISYITGGFKTNENGELYWVQEIGEEND